MTKKAEIVIVWLRRDLRIEDNVALYHALQSGYPVLPLFIFDTQILEQFSEVADRRVGYIHRVVCELDQKLSVFNSGVKCYFSTVSEAFEALVCTYTIKGVYYNEDYEPRAIVRDSQITSYLRKNNIHVHAYKDHVIFRGGEILKADGTPYRVYTPYAKKWKESLSDMQVFDYSLVLSPANFYAFKSEIPSLTSLGYQDTQGGEMITEVTEELILHYSKTRDFPALNGTSLLGTALRFGLVSIRKCVKLALKLSDVWLSELIWREFFSQILFLFPTVEHKCFKEKYEAIEYRNNEVEFQAWCLGNTGYPLVDAGMRELNTTGFMHNRVRMVVASFLVKHLLIDWRWGEAYFAQQLLDYDLASNNGNWQWVAGCGCDAAPYFRIFNPTEQAKKFDPDNKYLDKWVPEWRTPDYIIPLVEHRYARERALSTFKKALYAEK